MDLTHEHEQFALNTSGPPVAADEIEQPGTSSIEVVVAWGHNVLHVADLGTMGSFTLGETADFAVSADSLGRERLPVVIGGPTPRVVVPDGASAELVLRDATTSHAELETSGKLEASGSVVGARTLTLPDGGKARIELPSGLVLFVRSTPAAKKIAAQPFAAVRPRDFAVGGISLVAHSAFLFLLYFMAPTPSSLALDHVSPSSRVVRYMLEPSAVQQIDTPELEALPGANQASGVAGRAHDGPSGEMGQRNAPRSRNRYGIQGPRDNPDPHMAREEMRMAAQEAGIVGILRAQQQGSANAPTSEYGRATAIGRDPMSAIGALLGENIGLNGGFGGLGPQGTGTGAGGDGQGTIGVDMTGSIGNWGNGTDGPGGYGPGGPRGTWGRVVTDRVRPPANNVPRVRPGSGEAVGSLSREVIRRVVRRNLQQVRHCYERSLVSRPDLSGRVVMRWTITSTGSTTAVSVGSSTMGNPGVERCIAAAVARWTFPAPEDGGMVRVNAYPFDLQPADGQ
ncbi:MAG: AgmX/PglI C-terminal domain-containing protein [Deltaproteobacteria bacterium]|nr:AgmX/PglI C-terminal domain-containing protein [Deltaproteobacteria bacterium]